MPIEITLDSVSKRYKRDWIIQHLNVNIGSSDRMAILGQNGSGKSTLLKLICGFVSQTEGEVSWQHNDTELDVTEWHQHYTMTAPYLELIEEYTLQESIDFHFSLKSLRSSVDLTQVLDDSGLSPHLSKPVANFSSGMKQRLKLILTLCSEVPIYLLDEPCSNLDQAGIEWYQALIKSLPADKTVVVASNNSDEYLFCNKKLHVS